MIGKVFFLKFLPFLIVVTFFKGFFSQIFSYAPFDLFLVLVLSLIPLLFFNLWALLALIILSLLKGLEDNLSSFFWISYHLFLFWAFFQAQKLFKGETKLFRYAFWGLCILSFLIIKLFAFFTSLDLYTLTYPFWVHLLVKTLFYGLLTWIFTFVFYRLFARILIPSGESG
mgnify:CR=1 FL=1